MIFLLFVSVILVHILILSKLIFFPYPELFVYPYLTNRGLIPYRDILDQHFPGLMFFPINLDYLGMTTPEIARLWQYGVVVLTHIILFFVARKIFRSSLKALFSNFLYLVWQPFFEGWVLWIDSFLPIFLLVSFYFLSSWDKKREVKLLFFSGLLFGIALLLKQAVLPLVALIAFFIFFRRKKIWDLMYFGFGFLIPVVFLAIYIIRLGVWHDFFFWTITFNLTTFAEMGRKYPEASLFIRSLFVFAPAFVAGRKDILISLFILGSLAFAYARFDLVHLQPVLPFVVLGTMSVLGRIRKSVLAKIFLGFYLFAALFILTRFYQGHLGKKVFFFGETERKIVKEIEELTAPQDKIFAFGTLPHVYQMTGLLPPGNIFVFQFPWFMMKAEESILSGIISDPPKVVIRDPDAQVDDRKLIDNMLQIDQYVQDNYARIDKINGIEILLKNENSN